MQLESPWDLRLPVRECSVVKVLTQVLLGSRGECRWGCARRKRSGGFESSLSLVSTCMLPDIGGCFVPQTPLGTFPLFSFHPSQYPTSSFRSPLFPLFFFYFSSTLLLFSFSSCFLTPLLHLFFHGCCYAIFNKKLCLPK